MEIRAAPEVVRAGTAADLLAGSAPGRRFGAGASFLAAGAGRCAGLAGLAFCTFFDDTLATTSGTPFTKHPANQRLYLALLFPRSPEHSKYKGRNPRLSRPRQLSDS